MSEVGKVSLGFELEGASLGKQINSVAKMAGDRVANVMKSSMRGVGKGMKEVTISTPKVDVESTKAEIGQLTDVLDNVNAKIEIQQRKLSELNESLKTAFSEDRENRLHEQIINTEAAILRLTRQSDNASEKIWKLEDSLNNTGTAAEQVSQPVNTLNERLKKTNPNISTSNRRLKDVTKSAGLAGVAMASLGKRTVGMSNQFTQGFKRIAKQVLVFAVLYKAIRGLQSYIGSSLRTNDEYAKSMEQIKTNLKVAFSPIFQAILPALNALIKALVVATTYAATFVSALFGKTYKQSYEAAKGLDAARKSMDAYGKAGKKAGQTAGFDELNLLDTSTGEDDGGFGADLASFEAPEIDLDGIQNNVDSLMNNIQNSFNGLWERLKSSGLSEALMPNLLNIGEQLKPILGGWKESFKAFYGDIIQLAAPFENWIFTGLIPTWQTGIGIAVEIITGLMESLLGVFDTYREAMMPIWESFITNGLPMITDFIEQTMELFGGLFDVVKTIFDDLWSGAVDPVMGLISDIIQDVLDSIYGFWDNWGVKIFDGLKGVLDGIKGLWTDLWDGFLRPLTEKLLNVLTDLWNKHLKGLVDEVMNFVGTLVSAVLDIWNKFIMPIIRFLVKILGPIFAEVFGFIGQVIGTAVGIIADILKGLIKALGGVTDFIAGVFTLDFQRAWEGIKKFMHGIVDVIFGVFKGGINIVIDALNFFIKQLNRIKFDIPDWVPVIGGKGFGFDIAEIPKLAKGGLVTAPTLAMVGDNPGANVDPEVVAPLSKLQDMLGGTNQGIIEVLLMILDAIRNDDKEIVVKVGDSELGRVALKAIQELNRRAGRNLLLE